MSRMKSTCTHHLRWEDWDLGIRSIAKLHEARDEQNLLTRRIEDKLNDGVEYWRLEQFLCAAVAAKEEIKVEDVVRAQSIRSFDYRLMGHLLLYGLRGKQTELKTEEKYQSLLNGLEPSIPAKYRKRCEEAIKGGNCRAVPVLGTWKMPSLITDE